MRRGKVSATGEEGWNGGSLFSETAGFHAEFLLQSFHLSGSLGDVLWALNTADSELRSGKPRLTETEGS